MEQNKKGITLAELVATPYAAFNKRPEYEEQVMPLVMELHEKCKALNIPIDRKSTRLNSSHCL